MEIRKISATEYSELVHFVGENFEYRSENQPDKDFPQLFAPENREHLWVARDGSLMGHAGTWFTRLRVENSVWPVGGIGAVCTKKEQRGQGIAPKLIAKACEDLKSQGAALAFLWSGHHDFYKGMGFARVGQQWSIVIPHDGTRVRTENISQDKSEEFFRQSLPLLQKHPYGVERTEALHRLLLSTPSCQVFSSWSNGRLLAYVVINKGQDLGDHIHEWAGDGKEIDRLVHFMAQKAGRPLVFLCPQLKEGEGAFILEWEKQGYSMQAGIMALAKVLDGKLLAQLLTAKLGPALTVAVRDDIYICRTNGQEHLLAEAQLLEFMFGAGSSGMGLPLRLWWWGMESV